MLQTSLPIQTHSTLLNHLNRPGVLIASLLLGLFIPLATTAYPRRTRKSPGDMVTYTTTISNTAAVIVGSNANDATAVQLTNPPPLNATDPGSVSISPIAFDDVYSQTVIGNVSISDRAVTGRF